jgi:hypothetical protein
VLYSVSGALEQLVASLSLLKRALLCRECIILPVCTQTKQGGRHTIISNSSSSSSAHSQRIKQQQTEPTVHLSLLLTFAIGKKRLKLFYTMAGSEGPEDPHESRALYLGFDFSTQQVCFTLYPIKIVTFSSIDNSASELFFINLIQYILEMLNRSIAFMVELTIESYNNKLLN